MDKCFSTSPPGHARATGNGSCVVLGLVDDPGMDLRHEPSERLGDGLVPVSGRVLIDQRGARTQVRSLGQNSEVDDGVSARTQLAEDAVRPKRQH